MSICQSYVDENANLTNLRITEIDLNVRHNIDIAYFITIYAKCSLDLSPQSKKKKQKITRKRKKNKSTGNVNSKGPSKKHRLEWGTRVLAHNFSRQKSNYTVAFRFDTFARVHLLIECNLSQWQIIRTDVERTDITTLFTRAVSNRIVFFFLFHFLDSNATTTRRTANSRSTNDDDHLII